MGCFTGDPNGRGTTHKEESMRKLSTLMVLLVVFLSLAACGPEPTPTPSAGSVNTPVVAPTEEATPTEAMAADTPTPVADTPTTAPVAADATASPSPLTGDAGTMDAVRSRGKLIAGVKFDVPVFGYLNPVSNQNEGFDVEMAKAVAERIFGSPDAIEFKEAISANRIPYLQNGVVDVIFSTMTANEDRAKQIDFSDCYFVAGQSLLVPSDSTITGVADLAGKRVGTVQGSTSERNIRAAAPEATVELFATYAEAVQAMESGRVDVVTTDDIILYGFEKQAAGKFKVVGGQFTTEPYAAGVKQGNTDLLNEVNATIRDLKASGKWAEIYRTWISEDVPPIPPQEWRDAVPTATPAP
jgi:putative glutamine transport system substrate-binding protein